MPLLNESTGQILSDQEFQEHLRDVLAKKGRIILEAVCRPEIGEVQTFAGLPMRCVRYATYAEALGNLTESVMDGSDCNPDNFFFEVEIAD